MLVEHNYATLLKDFDHFCFSYFCYVHFQEVWFTETDYIPDVVCDYRAPDSCNPSNPPLPCCQRPEVLGDTTSTTTTASGVMVVSSILLMVTITLVTLLL